MPISKFFKRSSKKEVKQTGQETSAVAKETTVDQGVTAVPVTSEIKIDITSPRDPARNLNNESIAKGDIIVEEGEKCLDLNGIDECDASNVIATTAIQLQNLSVCDASDLLVGETKSTAEDIPCRTGCYEIKTTVEDIERKADTDSNVLVTASDDTYNTLVAETEEKVFLSENVETEVGNNVKNSDAIEGENAISFLTSKVVEYKDENKKPGYTEAEINVDQPNNGQINKQTEKEQFEENETAETRMSDTSSKLTTHENIAELPEGNDNVIAVKVEQFNAKEVLQETDDIVSSISEKVSAECEPMEQVGCHDSTTDEVLNESKFQTSNETMKSSDFNNSEKFQGITGNQCEIELLDCKASSDSNDNVSKSTLGGDSQSTNSEVLISDVVNEKNPTIEDHDEHQIKNAIDISNICEAPNEQPISGISCNENDSLKSNEEVCDFKDQSHESDGIPYVLDTKYVDDAVVSESEDVSRTHSTKEYIEQNSETDTPTSVDKENENHLQNDSQESETDSTEVMSVVEDLLHNVEKELQEEQELFLGKQTAFEEPSCVGDSSCSLLTDDECADDNTMPPQKKDSQNWKVGYLQVKLPTKSRKSKLKAWNKRFVVIQSDEFTSDSKTPSLMLSVYHSESGNSRRHSAMFWRSISSREAVVYRTLSKTHPYAFSIADNNEPVLYLASDSESLTQEWMTSLRNIFWPPNPVLQLEKVLNGNQFEISLIDNDLSYRAGLLGAYGYLTVESRKLILCHPQSGHVIQEWYLNTVDKFRILSQTKEDDANKILLMQTSKDSSTGCGEIRLFCAEAVNFLKSIASTIHKVLQYHAKQNNTCYKKELNELSDWLTPQPSPMVSRIIDSEDYYKVPPRQVRSLLDIPNFIFDVPNQTVVINVSASNDNLSSAEQSTPKLKPSTTCVSNFSQDSGISLGMTSDDFLNSSITSFTIGNKNITSKNRSSGSESSDSYSPPLTPKIKKRMTLTEENQIDG